MQKTGIPCTVGGCNESDLNSSEESAISTISHITPNIASERSISNTPNPTIMKLNSHPPKNESYKFIPQKNDTISQRFGSLIDIQLIKEHDPNDSGTLYDSYMEDAKCVETKLFQALLLQNARRLGLGYNCVNLGSFESVGGERFICKQLIRLVSKDMIEENMRQSLEDFCEKSRINFDEAIAQCINGICNGRSNEMNLSEAASLVRLSSDPQLKCQNILNILRAALLCKVKPSCLNELSKDAIKWAMEEGVKSEIEEATRLIVIDEIIRKYCGNGASDFFRVSNALHGRRLMQHVTRYVDEPTVLDDVFTLSDAFTHLSRADGCIMVLQRLVSISIDEITNNTTDTDKHSTALKRAEQCGLFIRKIHETDPKVAQITGTRLINYCSDILAENKDWKNNNHVANFDKKKSASLTASISACCILLSLNTLTFSNGSILLQDKVLSKMGTSCWNELLRKFQRIHSLQTGFSIFLSISDLKNHSRLHVIARQLLRPAVEFMEKENDNVDTDWKQTDLKSLLTHAKRGCTLLFCSGSSEVAEQWCKIVGSISCYLAKKASCQACMTFVEASGLLDNLSNVAAHVSIIAIASSLCMRATNEAKQKNVYSQTVKKEDSSLSSMKFVVYAASLLQDHALTSCPKHLLSQMVSLSSLTDIVIQVFARSDCGIGESVLSFKRSLDETSLNRREPSYLSPIIPISIKKCVSLSSAPTLHPNWYVGDGLLLPPLEVLQYSMDYCRELLKIIAAPQKILQNNYRLDGIPSFLLSRGAYTITLRLISYASTISMSCSNKYPVKEQCVILNTTLQNLAERSLGGSGTGITSGKIDTSLGLAHLLALPLKVAFKVYRACLPSAISRRDFHRVINLADIGARAGGFPDDLNLGNNVGWKNQKQFLSQCQQLSSNAHWWKLLKHYSVSFDPRLFENSFTSAKIKLSKKNSSNPNRNTYVASLISDLIRGSSKQVSASDLVLKLVMDYGNAFGIGTNLVVRRIIQLLPSGIAMCAILRRFFITLTSDRHSEKEYERYELVLNLYHNTPV